VKIHLPVPQHEHFWYFTRERNGWFCSIDGCNAVKNELRDKVLETFKALKGGSR